MDKNAIKQTTHHASDATASVPSIRADRSAFCTLAQNEETEYFSPIPSVVLRAHYDGEHMVLDEPFVHPPNATLAVTLLSPAAPEPDSERAEWAALSAKSLARAYGDDEPEYTLADLRR